jgi:hypothetical protein
MAISSDDIENAFLFVGMDQKFMQNAYLCKETGRIFYTSELGDSDELPEDIDDTEKYITIPHKKDFLNEKGLLDKWYKFEDKRQRAALIEWCQDNSIEIKC